MKPAGAPRVICQRLAFRRAATPGFVAVAAFVIAMGLVLGASEDRWPGVPVFAAALQPEHSPAQAAQPRAAGHEAGDGASHEGASPWSVVARLFNFAILAGTLVYFLRSPFVAFLVKRGMEIRADLVKAAELQQKAGEQLADIERRMAALPGEIEALQARGIEEIAAEEARIRAAADAERARLVEQARRQIDTRLRVAKREIIAHAADLAVSVASARIRETIHDEDQRRLLDQYVARLSAPSNVRAGSDAGVPGGGRP